MRQIARLRDHEVSTTYDIFGACRQLVRRSQREISVRSAVRRSKRIAWQAGLAPHASEGTVGNLERGSRARKSQAGRASAKRRGPRKAVGGEAVDQRRFHGARSRTRGRESSGGD